MSKIIALCAIAVALICTVSARHVYQDVGPPKWSETRVADYEGFFSKKFWETFEKDDFAMIHEKAKKRYRQVVPRFYREHEWSLGTRYMIKAAATTVDWKLTYMHLKIDVPNDKTSPFIEQGGLIEDVPSGKPLDEIDFSGEDKHRKCISSRKMMRKKHNSRSF